MAGFGLVVLGMSCSVREQVVRSGHLNLLTAIQALDRGPPMSHVDFKKW